MQRQSYIHYGNDHFDMDVFNARKIAYENKLSAMAINKPPFGFWACRTDDEFGWKYWCECEDFHTDRLDKSFVFTLSESARILTIRSHDDIEPFLTENPFWSISKVIDFEKIMFRYDALELIHGDNYTCLHDGLFYSWDVDSIVIWNPYIIEPR